MYSFFCFSTLLSSSFQSKISENYRHRLGFYRNTKWDEEIQKYIYRQDVTQLQPIHAREIFPCFDQPDMKGNGVIVKMIIILYTL